jgi:hypothetical protein
MFKKSYHKIGTVKFVKLLMNKTKSIVKIVYKHFSTITTSIITCSLKKIIHIFHTMITKHQKEKTAPTVQQHLKVTTHSKTVSKLFQIQVKKIKKLILNGLIYCLINELIHQFGRQTS